MKKMIIILIILLSITWLSLPAAAIAGRSAINNEAIEVAQKETDSEEHSEEVDKQKHESETSESKEHGKEASEGEHGSEAEDEHGGEAQHQEESFWRKIPLWQSIFAFLAVGFFIATSLTILPKIAAKDLEEHH